MGLLQDERSPGSVISDLGLRTNNASGKELEKQGTYQRVALEANDRFSSSDTASDNASKVCSSEGVEKKPVLIVVMVSRVFSASIPGSAPCLIVMF